MGHVKGLRHWFEDRRDTVVIVLLIVAFAWLTYQSHQASLDRAQIKRDEQTFISNGVPASTCLLEVFRQVEPLLAESPSAQRPLEAFLILQGHRYSEHRCPDRPGEAARLAQRTPTVR